MGSDTQSGVEGRREERLQEVPPLGVIYADLSMSLDGFITGPNARVGNPMGDDGDRLHEWVSAGRSAAETGAFMKERLASLGACVFGRTMLDGGIGLWGDEPPFHAPVFVVTHRPAETIVKAGGTSYTFVTDGPDAALRQARQAAGDREIALAGAAIVRHYLRASVLDELRLHIVPILLGGGTRLFAGDGDRPIGFTASGSVDDAGVAHLVYRPRG